MLLSPECSMQEIAAATPIEKEGFSGRTEEK
jgi:hypothetical protein